MNWWLSPYFKMMRCTTTGMPSIDCGGKLSLVGTNSTGAGFAGSLFSDGIAGDGSCAASAEDGSVLSFSLGGGGGIGFEILLISLSLRTLAVGFAGGAWSPLVKYRVIVCATGS